MFADSPKYEAGHMAHALKLAERWLFTTDPNPRVGCVLVKDGEVVGQGAHKRAGDVHAEVEALNQAGAKAKGSTAYVTLEPCCYHGKTPPCTEALIRSGVVRVVAAMRDPNPRVAGQGFENLRRAGVAVDCGMMESVAVALNRGYCKRMLNGLPYVSGKIAMSLDAKTALQSGVSRWITGHSARADVHRMRARSSAILTGIGTVLADNPKLTARLQDQPSCVVQPRRVVVDSNLRTPADALIGSTEDSALILTVNENKARIQHLSEHGFTVEVIDRDADDRVDLAAVLSRLGQLETNELMLEAGPLLSGAMLEQGLVDEWTFYVAPCIFGNHGKSAFATKPLTQMSDRFGLKLSETRVVGSDIKLIYKKPES